MARGSCFRGHLFFSAGSEQGRSCRGHTFSRVNPQEIRSVQTHGPAQPLASPSAGALGGAELRSAGHEPVGVLARPLANVFAGARASHPRKWPSQVPPRGPFWLCFSFGCHPSVGSTICMECWMSGRGRRCVRTSRPTAISYCSLPMSAPAAWIFPGCPMCFSLAGQGLGSGYHFSRASLHSRARSVCPQSVIPPFCRGLISSLCGVRLAVCVVTGPPTSAVQPVADPSTTVPTVSSLRSQLFPPAH